MGLAEPIATFDPAGLDDPSAPMPLPTDARVFFQGGLFILALLACLYVAGDIALPLVLAIILKLLLQPAIRRLNRIGVPRMLAAIALIAVVFGALGMLGAALSGPAQEWVARIPQGVPRLQERLDFLRKPVAGIHHFLDRAEQLTVASTTEPQSTAQRPQTVVATSGSTLTATVFSTTRNFASGFFTTVLLLFFLLASDDTFLRRVVEVLPRFADKRQAVEISRQIEADISAYLTTITIMNAIVGAATALVMWSCGIADPLLWGAVAFLFNYVPILGPLAGVAIFLVVGLLSAKSLFLAVLPGALYFGIHLIEGETVTPMLLARRFTLNPVLVVIALVFWNWMWGVPGAILAVPMLAIAKIICDRVRPLAAFGHFLGG